MCQKSVAYFWHILVFWYFWKNFRKNLEKFKKIKEKVKKRPNSFFASVKVKRKNLNFLMGFNVKSSMHLGQKQLKRRKQYRLSSF
jgi:hypothetical protein